MSSLKSAHAFINTVMFSAKLHVHEARLEPRTFLPVRYLCVATVMSELLEPLHFFIFFLTKLLDASFFHIQTFPELGL